MVIANIKEGGQALELEVPPETEAVLDHLASKIGGSKPEVLSWALALLKVAFEAQESGQRLMITDRDGRPISEISLSPEGDDR